MSGAILGCVAQSEPAADVLDRDYITHQAKRLFHVGIGDRVEDFDYPDVMHWSPPQNQLEAVRQENGFVDMGLGPARPSGDSFEARGKQEAVWQWLKLELGQTIVAKRRRNPRSMMPSNAVPSVKQPPERISTKNVAQLQDSIETTEPESLLVATVQRAIRSRRSARESERRQDDVGGHTIWLRRKADR